MTFVMFKQTLVLGMKSRWLPGCNGHKETWRLGQIRLTQQDFQRTAGLFVPGLSTILYKQLEPKQDLFWPPHFFG